METFVILSRQAASQQMKDQGKSPIASYDFLPPDHPRVFHSIHDLPIDTTNLKQAPPPKQHEIINLCNLITHVKSPIPNDCDTISTISHQPEQVHIQPPPSIHTTTNCQRTASIQSLSTADHHTKLSTTASSHIRITTPITSTRRDILTHILNKNTSNIIPPQTITQDIHFAPIITNSACKLAHIQINKVNNISDIISFFNNTFPNS
jgi:hypothetical protein